ncbi:MAG: WYL domain-containing protein [Microthrixaceae bacterium]|nr:WYL domain-containing protein [Microthrixaceae bacterium]
MTRPSVAERLPRVLAVLAYLHQEGSASVAELAARFGCTVEWMRRELQLLALCGVPPYDALGAIDVFVDGDQVGTGRLPHFVRSPHRLSRAEGLAVLAAGESLLASGLFDVGPLDEALDALAGALGIDRADVEVVVDAPPWRDALRDAADRSETVELTYYTLWRDEVGDHRVDPLRVALVAGAWYLDAWDHRADEVRKYRVSRVQDVRPTGARFDRPVVLDEPRAFVAPAAAREVRLALPASAAWAAEVYPAEVVARHDDGGVELLLQVVGTTWLERLLLRAGPDARVLEPAELTDLPARAARRLLARLDLP